MTTKVTCIYLAFFVLLLRQGFSLTVVGLELIELLPLPSDISASSFSCVALEVNTSRYTSLQSALKPGDT